MSELKEFSIMDFAELHDAARVPLSTLERSKRQGIYPYFGASGVIDHVDGFLFDGDYLLVSEDGENLNSRNTPIAFRAKGKFWVNNHAHVLKGKTWFANRLLEYVLNDLDLSPYVTGAVQPKLSQAALLDIRFELPNRVEDLEAIVEVLSSLDDKIDLLHLNSKTLEQLAETLFRQWFVEKSSGTMVALSEFVDHFTVSINPGKAPDTMYNHFSIPAYDNDLNPEQQAGIEILSNKYQVPSNCVLVSKLNPSTSRIWYVSNAVPENSICSTEFQVMKPKDVSLLPLVYYFLKSDEAVDELASAASGTSGSHQRVSPTDILNLQFAEDDRNKMLLFCERVTPWLEKQERNRSQIRTLTALRDTLLPKLMSGEVGVPDKPINDAMPA